MHKTTYRTTPWMLLIGVLSAGVNQPARAVTPWVTGDVFAGVGNGTYQVYDNTGMFKEAISEGLDGLTTGCAFNPSLTKLYTTNFARAKVFVYDDPSPHPVSQIIDTGLTSPGGRSGSVVFDAAGSFYVGHGDGNQLLHKYDAVGNLLMTFSPLIESRGSTVWNDLAADQRTMFYASGGGLIKRFDVGSNVQLPDFASIGRRSFALRLLLPADGRAGLIVANALDIKRLDGSGTVVQTYDVPIENDWFSMSLDPNGTSFWAGSAFNFYRFNLATGAIEVGPINTGTGRLGGLCIKGEIAPSLALEAQPASPQVVCGRRRCNVSITCNLPAVVGAPCANQVDLFVRQPRRSGTSRDSTPLSDGSSAKAPRRMIRFAFGVANVAPGQTAPVSLTITPRGKKIDRSGTKRRTGILEIRNVAGPTIGSTPVRIRLK
jgi:hypothetical protein